MKRNFIVDQEINLSGGTDFLNTKVYSDALKEMILNSPPDKPFTIGLFGDWGSGKSSIIKTTKEDLATKEHFKVKFTVFDAWKYSEDAFRRSFILSLSKNLNVILDKYEYNLYANQTEQINEFKINIPKWLWWAFGLLLIIIIGCYVSIPAVRTYALSLISIVSIYIISSSIFVFLNSMIKKDLIVKLLQYLQSLIHTKYDEERPLMFSPEQFSNAFDKIIEESTTELDRIIVVIDNIDRCEKHYATELLTTIKGFLESKEKVLFVLPVDENALKRHIRETHKADDKEAEEFLRKFFNVTLRIKPYHPTQIYVFAKQINSKYNLNFTDYTLDLVSKEYASNPRRIIQMFNNLSAELECFSDETFAKENETIICKFLILREEFPKYYYYLSKNPLLLSMSIEENKSHLTKTGADELENQIWSPELENFLNKTRVITEGVPIKLLNQLLSNSDVFSALSTEVQDNIENVQFLEVIKFIGGDQEKSTLVIDYIIEQLSVYKGRNLYSVSFLNDLDVLIEIDKETALNKTVNLRVEEIIKPILNEIYNAYGELDRLIIYSQSLMVHKRTYLVDSLIAKIEEEFVTEKRDRKWIVALTFAINTYKDKKTLKRLSSPFIYAYEDDRKILDDENINSGQIEFIAGIELYAAILKNITNISPTDPYYVDLIFVLSNSSPILTTGVAIIAKINELNPASLNKDTQQYTSFLQIINNLLDKIKVLFVSKPEQLQILGDLIWGDRSIPHPSYPGLIEYNTNFNYVSDILANSSEVNELLDFCFNIYRLTLNKVDIVPVLEKIRSTGVHQAAITDRLIKTLNEGPSLYSLFGFILGDVSYSTDYLSLIKSAFISNESGNYFVDDVYVENKLVEILNLIISNDSRKDLLTNFLEDVTSEKRVKGLLISLIPKQSKENILKLSKTLQSLSIDTILIADKIFEFSNNLDFLKVIAQTGEKNHVAQLVLDIMSKLQHSEQLNDAISIIMEIKKIEKSDAQRILLDLEAKRIGGENEKELNDVITQLKKISNID